MLEAEQVIQEDYLISILSILSSDEDDLMDYAELEFDDSSGISF